MAMTRLRISCSPFQMCSRKTRHDRGSERFERFPVVRALAKSDVHPVRAGAGERGDRDRPEGTLLARAADPEREPCRPRLGIVRRVHEAIVRAGEIGTVAIEEKPKDLRVFLELVFALPNGREAQPI